MQSLNIFDVKNYITVYFKYFKIEKIILKKIGVYESGKRPNKNSSGHIKTS